ncbi:alpha-galactosidase [Clostridium boliviensis]|uniref:Alpha-galactosidase n=1 Tax=Clostridium boliviensis TaxID=318465 RepID=A0ABU4GMM5_9CLOT|nr:alpha-galactosidase [Clostridium boliviensis]MDW2798856.1 alpha-galactosidase [Clostridium boliviensis]
MSVKSLSDTPPMGWNSYDYYDTAVTERDIRANAEYMAKHLKEFGWEYIVVDIQWYATDAGTRRDQYQYIPFGKIEMDEYSRLLPCPDRFPSSVGGHGFKPLADYIHELGLKFGIHIMRGIPRIAAHSCSNILNTDITADMISDPYSICSWNPDMYGVIPQAEGAQAYYNSVFQLYAQWGVDFIKCDDICRMDAPSAKDEIRMLHEAIINSGRQMVLSLSPGPARLEEAWHYETYANMWRITDDFWDDWHLLKQMFERCEHWQNHVSAGNYPDCDMLPVGMLGKGFGNERQTRFTKEEQITMLTLWCMFRSPLMIGGELTLMDEWTRNLLTNPDVLALLSDDCKATQLFRNAQTCIWHSYHRINGFNYLAVFNLSGNEREIAVPPCLLNQEDFKMICLKELWTGETFTCSTKNLNIRVPGHGASLYRF